MESMSFHKLTTPMRTCYRFLRLESLRLCRIGAVVVPLSAVIGGATGVSMYLGTERITKILWLGLNKFPHDKYIGMAMIGWAMGKIAAVREGPEATKHYAQLNCIPLLLWLITNFRGSAPLTTSIIPFLLFSGYVYTGFIE